MAGIDTGSSGGKQVNVELNLVPFIDLMSVMITFLLLTAVWTQVSMIQIGTSIYGKKTSEEQAPPPPVAEVPFRVDVREGGYRVLISTSTFEIPKVNNDYDLEALKARVEQIKATYPDKSDVVITMQDNLMYNELIPGMDILLQGGFSGVSIATGGGD